MLFSITMLDKPASEELRQKTRQKHLEYMDRNSTGIRLGGPLMSDDGSKMIGSLVIKEFEDRAEVESFIRNEPYNQAGLFETILIRRFHAVVDEATKDDE